MNPYIKIEHAFLGCDCGCCGYQVFKMDGEKRGETEFFFHQYGEERDDAYTDPDIKEWLAGLAEAAFPGVPVVFGDLYCSN